MLVFIFALAIPAPSLSAAPPQWSQGELEQLFPELSPAQIATLHSGEGLTNFYDDTMRLQYAPDIGRWAALQRDLERFDPSVGIETLFLLPLSEIRGSGDSADQFMLRVYNVLRRISSMEGIRYYSASRERMRIFYEESYTIRSADDRSRIPDQTVWSVPAKATLHIFQRDSSFGRNVYKAEYFHDGGTTTLSLVNLTQLFYRGIFPVVAPENLRLKISIVPADEGLLFYGNCAVDVISLLGMDDRVRDSFYNRVVALYGWFQEEFARTKP